ncbi:bifunctional diaminohydroxyphosphoribosylaminopyrimidine deaminase/5-amino-6-(5-phosphoribosylamino)uracil reductase RibD [Candidatus Rariloculus sp.]|uniref:bifunctional diaminohydroxyphosphoribosylaminopyrimidine deaminase/5-amino-6-(5-phosphoribosylamino)uracil reductase RibD n=1 Tax=Candidatus Rariloculus sp. TaxID=3101265 RepID=UPI003D0BB45B
MTRLTDQEYMARALRLARNGLNTTDPNPTVGCVLVRDGEIVGEGWTAPVGGPHAERVALAAAGGGARGATAFVTLEPCGHQGRTGPCTAALIEAGVVHVVCAMSDPNPLVSGAGLRMLGEAGVSVEQGLMEQSARKLNEGYLARMTRGRPWVRSKIATSLDGRTALASGESKWITGPGARGDVHRWRARSSAVLTGVGTVLADDPSLTARPDDEGAGLVQPLRVIVDSALRTPPAARTTSLPGEVVVFATAAATPRRTKLEAAGVRIEQVEGSPRCDLGQVLARLAELEVNDVWVEAGPTLNGALLAHGLIDELVLYYAPQILGDGARGMFALAPLARLGDRHELVIEDLRMVGRDLRILARPSTVLAPQAAGE